MGSPACGFELDLAKGEHKQEVGREEVSEERVFIALAPSPRGHLRLATSSIISPILSQDSLLTRLSFSGFQELLPPCPFGPGSEGAYCPLWFHYTLTPSL